MPHLRRTALTALTAACIPLAFTACGGGPDLATCVEWNAASDGTRADYAGHDPWVAQHRVDAETYVLRVTFACSEEVNQSRDLATVADRINTSEEHAAADFSAYEPGPVTDTQPSPGSPPTAPSPEDPTGGKPVPVTAADPPPVPKVTRTPTPRATKLTPRQQVIQRVKSYLNHNFGGVSWLDQDALYELNGDGKSRFGSVTVQTHFYPKQSNQDPASSLCQAISTSGVNGFDHVLVLASNGEKLASCDTP